MHVFFSPKVYQCTQLIHGADLQDVRDDNISFYLDVYYFYLGL